MSPLTITYPAELPVSAMRDEIAQTIAANQVVVIAGATGSGKSTQLPKILLEVGCERIAHTQPRRIAARSIAERVAEELGEEVGGFVGYRVRFTDKASADTRITVMTDGVLLNEIHRDRTLQRYDAIIIDEAHERSLTIDFLLGYLRQLLPRRPDLKVIVTSATIDPQRFSRHFGDAPMIEVSGRTYPVEIRYRPLVADAADLDAADGPGVDESGAGRSTDPDEDTVNADRDPLEAIVDALAELAREPEGDVLVFLSGESEIRDAEEAIRGSITAAAARGDALARATEVLPLYGRLSAAEQHRVFDARPPGVRRRIVLATNVAETSITVPGIRYVVDAGNARISRYSARSKIQRLPIEPISQASAAQRAGRCGRTSDGVCIRLYSEQDFLRRPEYTDPEILRTNLAAVILQMVSLGLGDIASFPFLQPPDPRGVTDGLDLLHELGALRSRDRNKTPQLTKVGRDLARLPIEPRFARMVVESRQHNVSREVMAIVSGLSIQDPRERPEPSRQRADELHARFADPSGDFMTLLNLWNYLEEQRRTLSSSAFRRLCRSEYLNYLRVREWGDVYRQLRQLGRSIGVTEGEPSTDSDAVHRSLLSGLLSHIGLRDRAKKDYVGARQTRFTIFPGSALAKRQPAAVMSAELVETSRLFARMNGVIDPAWAEPLAGDLVKRSYSEPRWEKKQGAVVATERVTLFGVTIVEARRVQFSRIDPEYARQLFIRHALVEGEWTSQQSFDRANTRLRRELQQLEERTRRRDLLRGDEAVFEFYDRRIPREVVSQRSFEGWWRRVKNETPDLLTLTRADLVAEELTEPDSDEFPRAWTSGDQRLRLSYRFEPGSSEDGVTATVPVALLPRLDPAEFFGGVPGQRTDLVVALIRSLPKNLRRNLVPAKDWAVKLVGELDGVNGEDFLGRLAAAMTRAAGVRVAVDDFDRHRVPEHLRMLFRVVDESGKILATGRDLAALKAEHGGAARQSVASITRSANAASERAGLTTWPDETLPDFVDSRVGGVTVRAYPALVDEGSTVALRVLATASEQATAHPDGVVRLLVLGEPSPVSYVRDHLGNAEKLLLASSPYAGVNTLLEDAVRAIARDLLFERHPDGMLRDGDEFRALAREFSSRLMTSLYSVIELTTQVLDSARRADRVIRATSGMALLAPLADAREQLDGLVHAGFLSETGVGQLRHLPRYLDGITERIAKLSDGVARDRAWMAEIQRATALYREAGGSIPLHPQAPARLVRVRWLLEEFRVSLFAQNLRTAEPVSLQRITKALNS